MIICHFSDSRPNDISTAHILCVIKFIVQLCPRHAVFVWFLTLGCR